MKKDELEIIHLTFETEDEFKNFVKSIAAKIKTDREKYKNVRWEIDNLWKD